MLYSLGHVYTLGYSVAFNMLTFIIIGTSRLLSFNITDAMTVLLHIDIGTKGQAMASKNNALSKG